MDCGKLEFYETKRTITDKIIYKGDGSPCVTYSISKEESEPRCLKCGRCVKFFKDADELGGER